MAPAYQSKNLFDYLETGESIDEFLFDFEGVHKEQVVKVLEMLSHFNLTHSFAINGSEQGKVYWHF